MDYEKKYKEAAKAVESLLFDAQIRHSKSVSAHALADIFLELKESEDERIRKSINRLIRYYHDVNFPTPEGFSRKDLLDWIEKQSEQELNKILDSSKLKPDPKPYWTMSPEYQLANEQKSTKWSEEDERIRQDIENLIRFALEDGSTVSPAAHTTKEKAINWIQFLKNRYIWKPSEGQMEALLSAIIKACPKQMILESLYQDLKKLRDV